MDNVTSLIGGLLTWATGSLEGFTFSALVIVGLLLCLLTWLADREPGRRSVDRSIKKKARRSAREREAAARRQAEVEREQARRRLAHRLRQSQDSADDIAEAAEIFAREHAAAKALWRRDDTHG